MNNDFALTLERWYEEHGRQLPWRNTEDAYRIWVSEIILQQTRVVQGYDYYIRFVHRFPDVETLASASEDEVLKYWQGLGYYSRARNLHAAARQIVEGGGFPRSYAGIRALRGVGDYTAAAIASFAFGMPYAVVDGNVYRVLSRYFGIEIPIDSTAGRKHFAALAQELLDENRPAVYNQAIMDFGAMQCTPKCPREKCLACPLVESCRAFAEREVERYPLKQHNTRVSVRYFTYVYLRAGVRTCLHKRGEGDIWQGLYEPPLLETREPAGPDGLGRTAPFDWLTAIPGARLSLLRQGVKHQLSHRLLVADFYLLELPEVPTDGGGEMPSGWFWTAESELGHYAVPRLVSQLWQAVGLTPD